MKLLQMPRRQKDSCTEEAPQSGVLTHVWATEGNLARNVHTLHAEGSHETGSDTEPRERSAPVFRVVLAPQTAFYRTYTEALLRRYGTLSLENGRVPSLLGRELFRGRVTSCRMQTFDDVIIFVHDVEQCIRQLTPEQQRLIVRIAVQEYTFAETAEMLRLSHRSIQRRYHGALDELTSIFLARRLMERIATDPCQEGGSSVTLVSSSI